MTITAVARERNDGRVELRSPVVGFWRDVPAVGSAIAARGRIGTIEVLGRSRRVLSPAAGVVVEVSGAGDLARHPVAYGELLVVLGDVAERVAVASAELAGGDLVFRAPSSGRFYGRPGPDKDPFVSVGDRVKDGQTICLLEVMKTFNRIAYGGDGLPAAAKIASIGPADGDDLSAGDIILELESVP